MIATILALNLNATKQMSGKTYTGVQVTYQGEPYKGQEKPPTERFLFKNNPVAQKLENFKPGDVVEITFDTDKWKTPLDITYSVAPAPAKSTPQATTPQSSGDLSYSDKQAVFAAMEERKQESIARSVAIKEATNIVMAMIDKEVFTKKNAASYEFLAETVVETAKMLVPWLTDNETPEEVQGSDAEAADMEQERF